MAFSARPTSTDELTKLVNLPAHGFVVGDIVTFLTVYIKSQAFDLAHCQGAMMVSIVPDANSFYVTQNGWVSGLPAIYVPGIQYYVSPSVAGTLTGTIPTTTGQVQLPCFVADSTTSGYFFTGAGNVVQSDTIMQWTVVTSNTQMEPNNGYIVDFAGNLTMTLPTAFQIGDQIMISANQGTYTIAQNTLMFGQNILFGNQITTDGAAGSVSSRIEGDSLTLVANSDNFAMSVFASIGNFTIV
jgi:hypothetical protein